MKIKLFIHSSEFLLRFFQMMKNLLSLKKGRKKGDIYFFFLLIGTFYLFIIFFPMRRVVYLYVNLLFIYFSLISLLFNHFLCCVFHYSFPLQICVLTFLQCIFLKNDLNKKKDRNKNLNKKFKIKIKHNVWYRTLL